jgi:hypothetical protein
MGTPKCHRLYRARLFDPDVCPCSWGKKAVDKSLARIEAGLSHDDGDFSYNWVTISALFVENS